MAQSNALVADNLSPGSDSVVRLRSSVHPLLVAIENAPLVPVSDEENAQLDEILRTTTHWLINDEFVAAADLDIK